jgi:hypothetical protein
LATALTAPAELLLQVEARCLVKSDVAKYDLGVEDETFALAEPRSPTLLLLAVKAAGEGVARND